MTIQTCGSFDEKDNLYSLTIVFETHSITFDILTKEDLKELQSCINCLLYTEESP